MAKALTSLGQIERDLQNNAAAREQYEEAVAIYRAEGDALKLAHTIRPWGTFTGMRDIGNWPNLVIGKR